MHHVFTINHIVFCRIPVILESQLSGGGVPLVISGGRVHTPCALPHDPPMVHHTGSEGVNAVETRVMFNIDRLSGLEQTFTELSVCFQVVKEAEQMRKNQTLISHMRFFQQELVNYLR